MILIEIFIAVSFSKKPPTHRSLRIIIHYSNRITCPRVPVKCFGTKLAPIGQTTQKRYEEKVLLKVLLNIHLL